MFYYEVYGQEFDDAIEQWCPYKRERSFTTNILMPEKKILAGFDVVNSVTRTSPECSPLSCNSFASEIRTNSHCVLPDFETAKHLIETGRFKDSEPGPYRIFAVNTLEQRRLRPLFPGARRFWLSSHLSH